MSSETVRKHRREKTKKVKEERKTTHENHLENQLADRVLLLLSFKDTSTQNLRYILNVLGIHTLEEKKKILLEIYRLIREGIVYVPRGLPQLIDPLLDANKNSVDGEDIHICLLRPYEELIKEIQNDITQLQTLKKQNVSQ
ncbi:MAG: hypothetical protein ACFFFH_11345 [Candidatus Thorarchaeota archaeon]